MAPALALGLDDDSTGVNAKILELETQDLDTLAQSPSFTYLSGGDGVLERTIGRLST